MVQRKDSYIQPPYATYRYGSPTYLERGLKHITIVGLENERERIIVREPMYFRDDVDCVDILKDTIRRAEKNE